MAARPFIVLGDRTDHGGVVVEASAMTDAFGIGIARVGDQVTCPKRGHGTTVIVTGDPTMIIDGKPAVRHGDRCACGAVLISSQFLATIDDGAAAHSAQAREDRDATSVSSSIAQPPGDAPQEAFDLCFVLKDIDGHVLPNTPYRLSLSSGSTVEGRSDSHGLTLTISSSSAETVLLEVFKEEPPLQLGWDA